MFVDNLLSAIIRHLKKKTNLLIVSSVKSLYILLEFLDPINKPELPPTKDINKMVERLVVPKNEILGEQFKNITLMISIEDYKFKRILLIIDKK